MDIVRIIFTDVGTGIGRGTSGRRKLHILKCSSGRKNDRLRKVNTFVVFVRDPFGNNCAWPFAETERKIIINNNDLNKEFGYAV